MATIEPLADDGATPNTLTRMDAADAAGSGGSSAAPLIEMPGPAGASLSMKSVADLLPAEVGENVILTEHDAPGTMGEPQLFDCAKIAASGPPRETPLISRTAVPVFVIPTVCAVETLPTIWPANVTLLELTEATDSVPFPDKVTDALDAAFVCISRTALIGPVPLGENVTATVQSEFTARVDPQPFEIPNAEGFVPVTMTLDIESGAVPELEMTTVCEGLIVANRWLPNAKMEDEMATVGSG